MLRLSNSELAKIENYLLKKLHGPIGKDKICLIIQFILNVNGLILAVVNVKIIETFLRMSLCFSFYPVM